MLYELLPHALREPEVRARFADEYRAYREVDGDCLSGAARELTEEELVALAAVSIAVVEGLGIQRALDPEGFDHERAWRMWRDVIGAYLVLPPAPDRATGRTGPIRRERRRTLSTCYHLMTSSMTTSARTLRAAADQALDRPAFKRSFSYTLV